MDSVISSCAPLFGLRVIVAMLSKLAHAVDAPQRGDYMSECVL